METLKVLTEAELQGRFDKVCKDNWLVKKMAEGIAHKSAKELIDNWPKATRSQLLSKLNIVEHELYKNLYQDKALKSE